MQTSTSSSSSGTPRVMSDSEVDSNIMTIPVGLDNHGDNVDPTSAFITNASIIHDKEHTLQHHEAVRRPYFERSNVVHTPPKDPIVQRIENHEKFTYGVPLNRDQYESSGPKQSLMDVKKIKRIRVCIRKRPLTRRELSQQELDVVKTSDANTIMVDEAKLTIDLAKYIQQHVYVFDEVFDINQNNKDVYDRTAKPLINHIFNKGCATCFAFGQTGAGKTYTLLGTQNMPGLYWLAAVDMFNMIQSGQFGRNLQLWISYYEIYCSQLYDLLNKRKRLYVRENSHQKVCIVGLMETRVQNEHDVTQVVQYGTAVRSTGNTGVNPQSSRSHAVLQMELRNVKNQRHGRLSFIDLAGSERASDIINFDRKTRLEGAEINQSLLALKECIRSLDQQLRHTPYRQSKLTHILRDSFIGNSRTCMIANISPALTACENTLNTLRYADRVKELKKPMSDTSTPSASARSRNHSSKERQSQSATSGRTGVLSDQDELLFKATEKKKQASGRQNTGHEKYNRPPSPSFDTRQKAVVKSKDNSGSPHKSIPSPHRNIIGHRYNKAVNARNHVIVSHEDHLSEITSLCKEEMALLLSVRRGEKSFSDYIQSTASLLNRKAISITTMKENFSEFKREEQAPES